MPRNPHKTRCSVPGCRNWAMRNQGRDGEARCRSHRDAELGPRGAGAPQGNLNALVHGRYSNPLSPPDLERLVAVAVDRPDDLPLEIGLAVRSIYDRTRHPLLTLLALRRLLAQVAAQIFARLLRAELRNSPSASESASSLRATAHAPRLPDRTLPRLLTRLSHGLYQRDLEAGLGSSPKQKNREKQLPEPGSNE